MNENVTMGWQPIETAPTDGTVILGCFPDSWLSEQSHSVDEMYCFVNAGISSWATATDHDTAPTHWMPRPPFPTT